MLQHRPHVIGVLVIWVVGSIILVAKVRLIRLIVVAIVMSFGVDRVVVVRRVRLIVVAGTHVLNRMLFPGQQG